MDVVVKALALVTIVAIGQGIKRIGWVKASDFGMFSKIVLRITLPCALVTAFNDYEMPVAMLGLALVGVVANTVLQVTGHLLERRRGPQAQALAVLNLASFNMGAFATPYLAGFMGPAAVVQASLFDVGNSFAAAGVGYAWGTGLADESRRTTPAVFLRAMFSSVIFDVYLALVVMKLAHLRLPDEIITFTATVGSANTFLAMLMIGIGLRLHLDKHQYRQSVRCLAIRYSLMTVMALVLWQIPLLHDFRVLLCVVLFAPVASMTPGFTAEIKGDVALSSFMTSVSILVGIVAMPLLLVTLT